MRLLKNQCPRGRVNITFLALFSVAVAAVILRPPWRERVGHPVEPTLSYTQDTAGVHVLIHNRNAHWGMRHQHVVITLHDDRTGFDIIRTYGPDDDFEASFTDDQTIHCCEITLLAPHGDYLFDLWPSKHKVYRITITLRGGDGWVRM
jgi:hypothetical protein